jgi:hypothetical protein
MRASVAALAGGAALAIGARLPWMSFYAGLAPLRGTRGLYGQTLLGCGLVLIAAGIVLAAWPSRRLAIAVGLGGGVCALSAGYLASRMLMAVSHVSTHDPMAFVRPGPGLWLAIAGSALAATAPFLFGPGGVPSAARAA